MGLNQATVEPTFHATVDVATYAAATLDPKKGIVLTGGTAHRPGVKGLNNNMKFSDSTTCQWFYVNPTPDPSKWYTVFSRSLSGATTMGLHFNMPDGTQTIFSLTNELAETRTVTITDTVVGYNVLCLSLNANGATIKINNQQTGVTRSHTWAAFVIVDTVNDFTYFGCDDVDATKECLNGAIRRFKKYAGWYPNGAQFEQLFIKSSLCASCPDGLTTLMCDNIYACWEDVGFQVCSNSVIEKGEECDDGNLEAGDGCSDTCTIEDTSLRCFVPGELCFAACGDGELDLDEECDDGNNDNGDGCNSSCQPEEGFDCSGNVCGSICGDQIIIDEDCDDGNNNDNDGCASDCTIEDGWTCDDQISCQAICGDGSKKPTEHCDDGNTDAGDGCSDVCVIELGHDCPTENQPCETVCGDGFAYGLEICDDANTDSSDACDCYNIDPLYFCPPEGGPCKPICGDGNIIEDEECDDGDINSLDGCSFLCEEESGWTCTGEPSVCEAVCGDGVLLHDEVCDHPLGCNSICSEVLIGWDCEADGITCYTTCQDAVRVPSQEDCDDGNNVNGDGCNTSCGVETGYQCIEVGLDTHSTCAPECGDGMVVGNETCDVTHPKCNLCQADPGYKCDASSCWLICGDNVMDPGEECDASSAGCVGCIIQNGWDCSAGTSCSEICGDGIIVGTEACDDGNQVSNDGCNCAAIDPAFNCVSQTNPATVCTPICGNGVFSLGETCDDSDTDDGDGCSSSCQEEFGWSCDPYVCTTPCGDGMRTPNEVCDDGDQDDGDGCASTCQQVEQGWTCTGDDPTVCTPICGDTLILGAEECDDGNLIEEDECMNDCTINRHSRAIIAYGKVDKYNNIALAMKSVIPVTANRRRLTGATHTVEIPAALRRKEILESDIVFTLSGPREPYTCTTSPRFGETNDVIELTLVCDQDFFGLEVFEITDIKNLKMHNDNIDINARFSENLEIQTNIVMPTESDKQKLAETSGEVVRTAVLAASAIQIISSMINDEAFYFLYALFNALQLLHFLPMISVYFPYHTVKMFEYISFANMNNVYLQQAFDSFFDEEDMEDFTPVNYRFVNQGFETTSIFLNSGDALFYWILIIMYIPINVVMYEFSKNSNGWLSKKVNSFQLQLQYNFFIRAALESFLDLGLSALLNAYFFQFGNASENSSTCTAIGIIFFLSCFYLWVWYAILFKFRRLSPLKRKQFDSLTDEIEDDSMIKLMFYPLFLTKRGFLLFTLVFFKKSPFTQCMMFCTSCAIQLMHILIWRPFSNKRNEALQIVNEFIVLLIGCSMFMFVDPYYSPWLQDLLGWVDIGLVCLMCLINALFIIVPKIVLLVMFLSYLICGKFKSRFAKKKDLFKQGENKLAADKLSKKNTLGKIQKIKQPKSAKKSKRGKEAKGDMEDQRENTLSGCTFIDQNKSQNTLNLDETNEYISPFKDEASSPDKLRANRKSSSFKLPGQQFSDDSGLDSVLDRNMGTIDKEMDQFYRRNEEEKFNPNVYGQENNRGYNPKDKNKDNKEDKTKPNTNRKNENKTPTSKDKDNNFDNKKPETRNPDGSKPSKDNTPASSQRYPHNKDSNPATDQQKQQQQPNKDDKMPFSNKDDKTPKDNKNNNNPQGSRNAAPPVADDAQDKKNSLQNDKQKNPSDQKKNNNNNTPNDKDNKDNDGNGDSAQKDNDQNNNPKDNAVAKNLSNQPSTQSPDDSNPKSPQKSILKKSQTNAFNNDKRPDKLDNNTSNPDNNKNAKPSQKQNLFSEPKNSSQNLVSDDNQKSQESFYGPEAVSETETENNDKKPNKTKFMPIPPPPPLPRENIEEKIVKTNKIIDDKFKNLTERVNHNRRNTMAPHLAPQGLFQDSDEEPDFKADRDRGNSMAYKPFLSNRRSSLEGNQDAIQYKI